MPWDWLDALLTMDSGESVELILLVQRLLIVQKDLAKLTVLNLLDAQSLVQILVDTVF